jgi:hypothetical protein
MKLAIIIASIVRFFKRSDPWAGAFYRQRSIRHMMGRKHEIERR